MRINQSQTKDRVQEIICSLLPDVNETTFSQKVKANPDLQRQLTLLRGLSKDHARPPSNAFNANEVLQVFQMHPWDYSWQPPLAGDPSEVANEIYIVVGRTICRVPPFDFVWCKLGYIHKAKFIGAILDVACTIRDRLRGKIENFPEVEALYIQVEELLRKQDKGLAHWIIASSISLAKNGPYDALALGFMPIQKVFAENEDLVLKRLDYLNKQFPYIGERCNWDRCSTDLSFWVEVRELLWSEGLDASNEATVSRKATGEKMARFARRVRSFIERLRAMF